MQRSLVSGVVALALLMLSSVSAGAQSPACPMLTEALVSTTLGTPVTGKYEANIIPGFDSCDFIDPDGTGFTVMRESNAFGPGEGGAAALARRYIPQLPDAAGAQIDALSQIGINIAVPGYEISAVTGLGDAAIWVKTELLPGIFNDSLIVQHGGDALSFNMDDVPDAQAKLSTLARTTLANLTP